MRWMTLCEQVHRTSKRLPPFLSRTMDTLVSWIRFEGWLIMVHDAGQLNCDFDVVVEETLRFKLSAGLRQARRREHVSRARRRQ